MTAVLDFAASLTDLSTVSPLPSGMIKVALFCGGRGSTPLIQHLIKLPQISLSLLINAYDDGLSTGELRDFIPGMLGPSDFRKNLSNVLGLYADGQYPLQKLLELRLPLDATDVQIEELRASVESDAAEPPFGIGALLDQIDVETAQQIKICLRSFFRYEKAQSKKFKYADCSLGNLIFAGAYLDSGHDFNRANDKLGRMFDAHAALVNVCEGVARTLVALKENGDILRRESDIVGTQDPSPIHQFCYLDKPLSSDDIKALSELSVAEKAQRLNALDKVPHASPQAIRTIENADIIIFGPGTQHSSLLPSYKINGIGDALQRSPARVKAFIVNLQHDNDIQSCDAQDLVDAALRCMKDEENLGHGITHILCNENSIDAPSQLPIGALATGPSYKGAAIIRDRFQNPAKPQIHSGELVIPRILDVFYHDDGRGQKDALALQTGLGA